MRVATWILPAITTSLLLTGCGGSIGTISSVASIASSYVALRDYIHEEKAKELQAAKQQTASSPYHQSPTAKRPIDQPLTPSPPRPKQTYANETHTTQPPYTIQNYFAYPVE